MAATEKVWVNNSPPQLDDVDLNGFKAENNNLITSSGQTLNTSDNNQTAKAVAIYSGGGDFYVDSGTANAYILSPSGSPTGTRKAPPAYFAGMKIRFFPAHPNTTASTVNVATLGNKALISYEGLALVPGQLAGYAEAVYNGTDFQLTTPTPASLAIIKPGMIIPCAANTPDSGFFLCNHQAVSRTTYSALFARIGTIWGAGDGSTTFNVPDLRGMVLVGSGGTNDANLGNAVGDSGGSRTHTLSASELPAHSPVATAKFESYGLSAGALDLNIVSPDGLSTSNTTVTIANLGTATAFSLIQQSSICVMQIKF